MTFPRILALTFLLCAAHICSATVSTATVSTATAEDVFRSGLRVGQFAQPFNVRDCTGPAAGKTLCYYCRYGSKPVVAVFLRELTDDAGKLIATIDKQVRRHRQKRMAAFVVLLADNPFEGERRLKAFARKHKIVRTPLTIYRDTPELLTAGYQISPQASTTIVMWRASQVRANRAFKAPAISDKAIQQVVDDTKSILTNRTRPNQ